VDGVCCVGGGEEECMYDFVGKVTRKENSMKT
jgi:hypothetical protein